MIVRRRPAPRRPIPILSYHQTDALPPAGTLWRNLVTPPALFERQMRALARGGWRGLSMRDLEPYLAGEREGKVFGLTFDDGFASNLLHALPVVQALGFTATLFVVTDQIGGQNIWDAPSGIPMKPMMTVEQLRQWQAAGMDVGSHTQSHCDLFKCDVDRARSEMAGSKQVLEDLLDVEVRSFCFPYGGYLDEHMDMLRGLGYTHATTCESRRAPWNADPLRLPRITPWSSEPLPLFLARVTTGFEDWRRNVSDGLRSRRLRGGVPWPASDLPTDAPHLRA